MKEILMGFHVFKPVHVTHGVQINHILLKELTPMVNSEEFSHMSVKTELVIGLLSKMRGFLALAVLIVKL